MQAILSADQNWGIGKDGGLLVRVSEDMKFFRETTRGHAVVMGRKTFESLPGALPGRRNIVLSRGGFYAPGVETAADVAALFALLGGQKEDAFVIGGGEIYRLLLPWCRTCHITRVYEAPESDAFFPDLDRLPQWRLARSEAALAHGDTAYQFLVYQAEGEGLPCRS